MAARNSGSRAWARRRESRSTPSATCSSATAAAQFSRSAPAGRYSCSRRSSLPSRRIISRSAPLGNCSLQARQHRVSTEYFASIRRARSAPFFEDWAGRRGSRSTARGISTSPHRTLDAAVSCESLPMAEPNKCSAAAALSGSLSCRGIAPSSLPAARSSALTGTSRGSRCRDNPTMKAEIIAVGSELLTPDRVDTNSLFLTGELNRLGIEVTRKTVVGDELGSLRAAFDGAMERVELVIASGGLGPTEDDRTRETVAELLGRKLLLNDAILRYIEGRFRQLGREMPAVNVRQAMVPEGAEVLENPRGSAPGLWIEDAGR